MVDMHATFWGEEDDGNVSDCQAGDDFECAAEGWCGRSAIPELSQ